MLSSIDTWEQTTAARVLFAKGATWRCLSCGQSRWSDEAQPHCYQCVKPMVKSR